MEYPVYKPTLTKPPINGWHCVVDGYDFTRPTRQELIDTIRQYMLDAGIEGSPERMVETTFCQENPDQCWWGNRG